MMHTCIRILNHFPRQMFVHPNNKDERLVVRRRYSRLAALLCSSVSQIPSTSVLMI